MSISFRQANDQDKAYLLSLRQLTMVAHLEASGQYLTLAEHQDRVDHAYEANHLIYAGQERVGVIKYQNHGDRLEILQLQIHPDFQGKGYGTQVLLTLLNMALPNRVTLSVLKNNPAYALYLRLGFEVIGEDKYEFMLRSTPFYFTSFSPEYASALTQIWRTSMQAAIHQAPIHEFDSQAYYLTHILAKTYQIQVAMVADQPVGFMVFNEKEINQLYLDQDHQGQGIGRALIEMAKSLAYEKQGDKASLSLRTFEVNQKAKAFYQALGFVSSPGNKDNEEGLLDLVFTWSAK